MLYRLLILVFLQWLQPGIAAAQNEQDYCVNVAHRQNVAPGLAAQLGITFIAPIYVYARTMVNGINVLNGCATTYEAAQDLLHNGAPYLAGYYVIRRTLDGVDRAYISTRWADMREVLDAQNSRVPERVLLIDGLENAADREYADADIAYRYANHPNVRHERVRNAQELEALLERLNREGQSFDQIEFWGHGAPGHVKLGDTLLNEEYFRRFSGQNLRIARAGAEIRLIGCAIGGNLRNSSIRGEALLTTIGRAFLPQGGRVTATTRAIQTLDRSVSLPMLDLGGFGNIPRLLRAVLVPPLHRYYSRYEFSRDRFIEVTVPAQNGCPANYAAMVRRIR